MEAISASIGDAATEAVAHVLGSIVVAVVTGFAAFDDTVSADGVDAGVGAGVIFDGVAIVTVFAVGAAVRGPLKVVTACGILAVGWAGVVVVGVGVVAGLVGSDVTVTTRGKLTVGTGIGEDRIPIAALFAGLRLQDVVPTCGEYAAVGTPVVVHVVAVVALLRTAGIGISAGREDAVIAADVSIAVHGAIVTFFAFGARAVRLPLKAISAAVGFTAIEAIVGIEVVALFVSLNFTIAAGRGLTHVASVASVGEVTILVITVLVRTDESIPADLLEAIFFAHACVRVIRAIVTLLLAFDDAVPTAWLLADIIDACEPAGAGVAGRTWTSLGAHRAFATVAIFRVRRVGGGRGCRACRV